MCVRHLLTTTDPTRQISRKPGIRPRRSSQLLLVLWLGGHDDHLRRQQTVLREILLPKLLPPPCLRLNAGWLGIPHVRGRPLNGDPLAYPSLPLTSVGITGLHHHTWLHYLMMQSMKCESSGFGVKYTPYSLFLLLGCTKDFPLYSENKLMLRFWP